MKDEFPTKPLLFAAFLINSISLIHAQNSCPSSHCGSSKVTVHYPFRFEHEAPPITSCTYFNLTCDEAESTVAVNLPNAGEFRVQKIDYGEKYIQLYDPANCLVPRLLDLSLDSSPLKGILDNFTLYVCPSELNADSIPCLSNSTNITIAVSDDDSYLYGDRCEAIRSEMMSVDRDHVFLYLTWFPADCVKCESGSWGSRAITKIVAVALTLPGLIIMALSCCSVFCFHLMKMLRDRFDGETAAPMAVAPPPLGASSGGLDESKIMGCVELVVVSESNEGLIQSGYSKTCTICLENYCEKETVSVISKCGHCFHANCIHQWLGKNATCPVCRISLSDAV